MSVNTGTWEIAATADSPFPTVDVSIDPEQTIMAVASRDWVTLTRQQFEALDPPDPQTVYLVVGS